MEDVKEHLKDGESAELVRLRKMLTAWAKELAELPDPVLPIALMKQAGRVGDNWRPLLAVANLAGERWWERAGAAVLAAVGAERSLSLVQRLLLSIKKAFTPPVIYDDDDNEAPQDPICRIETKELLRRLIADRSEEWDIAYRGKPITQYWLRDNLRGLLDPPGAQDWQEGQGPARRRCSGYHKAQFTKAWRSHLAGVIADADTPSPHPGASGTSSSSGSAAGNKEKSRTRSTPASGPSGTNGKANHDPDIPDDDTDRVSENSSKSAALPDGPDVPDAPGIDGSISANGNGAADPQPEIICNLVEKQIVKTWLEHKDWAAIQIARECGVTRKRVQLVLSRHQNGSAPGAAL